MDSSLLVRIFGFPATLIHGDSLVYDRWRWLKRRLPITGNGERLIDIGCGSGAFTIGAAKRGYTAMGLSWDEKDLTKAKKRAKMCRAHNASFEICDVRHLHERKEYNNQFDVAICTENIEHIIDDFKLMRDIKQCLKPGGRLLLTTPSYHLRSNSSEIIGPFNRVETGGHMRRGYTKCMLLELCRSAGLVCEEISYCSGVLSTKNAEIQGLVTRIHPLLGWSVSLPLRPFIPFLDPLLTSCLRWPYFSIALEAFNPRQQAATNCSRCNCASIQEAV